MTGQLPREPDAETDAPADEAALERAIEELSGSRRAIEAWLKVATALEGGAALDAARLLSRAAASARHLAPALRAAAAAVEALALERRVLEQARMARLHYRERLELAFDAAELRWHGSWPSYRIDDVVRVEIEFAAAPERIRATVSGKLTASAEPARIALAARAQRQELLERPFPAEAFVRELRELSLRETSGGWADLRRLHTALRERMREDGRDLDYGEAKFAADLYRLLSNQPAEGDVETPELSPAPHARDGIYVPAPGGGNFIAAIRFGRDGDGRAD